MGAERPDDDTGARDGKGINRMMEMVQGSRFGVALMGLGIMRRSFLEAAIYAHHRYAFGRPISEYPLVRETLVNMAAEVEAGCAIAFEASEAGVRPDADSKRLYRILVPLACAAHAAASTGVAGGGDYGATATSRTGRWRASFATRSATRSGRAQRTSSLSTCCAMAKERADEALFGRIERAQVGAEHPALASTVTDVGRSLDEVKEAAAYLERAPQEVRLLQARRIAEYMADVTQAALLVEEAAWELANKNSARKAIVARHFASMRLGGAPVRGIMSEDRTVLDYFEPIVRYQPVPKEALG
jgi:acyl-CoA dehydrogenase